jgi:hypothetical protein
VRAVGKAVQQHTLLENAHILFMQDLTGKRFQSFNGIYLQMRSLDAMDPIPKQKMQAIKSRNFTLKKESTAGIVQFNFDNANVIHKIQCLSFYAIFL